MIEIKDVLITRIEIIDIIYEFIQKMNWKYENIKVFNLKQKLLVFSDIILVFSYIIPPKSAVCSKIQNTRYINSMKITIVGPLTF